MKFDAFGRFFGKFWPKKITSRDGSFIHLWRTYHFGNCWAGWFKEGFLRNDLPVKSVAARAFPLEFDTSFAIATSGWTTILLRRHLLELDTGLEDDSTIARKPQPPSLFDSPDHWRRYDYKREQSWKNKTVLKRGLHHQQSLHYRYIYICCRVKSWSKIWAFIS